jgi:acyl-CoA hydrolase
VPLNIQPNADAQGRASLLEVVLPEQANHYGTLYGANALHMMGKAAFVCATRHARGPVVMAKADGIEFFRPIPLGAIIEVRAHVAFQGRSSMTVVVEIVPEHPGGEPARPAIAGRFMMVAVDGDGRPVPIPVSDQRTAEEVRT